MLNVLSCVCGHDHIYIYIFFLHLVSTFCFNSWGGGGGQESWIKFKLSNTVYMHLSQFRNPEIKTLITSCYKYHKIMTTIMHTAHHTHKHMHTSTHAHTQEIVFFFHFTWSLYSKALPERCSVICSEHNMYVIKNPVKNPLAKRSSLNKRYPGNCKRFL